MFVCQSQLTIFTRYHCSTISIYIRVINFSRFFISVKFCDPHLVSRLSKTGVIIAEMQAVADLHISRVERNGEERRGALITTGDSPSRSNFASRRVSKGSDWRNIWRYSINWRITSSLAVSVICRRPCAARMYSFRYASWSQAPEDEEKKEERKREKMKRERGDGERREKRRSLPGWRMRGERNEPIKVQSSCTPGASGCRDVTCGYVYTVSPHRANNICKFARGLYSRHHDISEWSVARSSVCRVLDFVSLVSGIW